MIDTIHLRHGHYYFSLPNRPRLMALTIIVVAMVASRASAYVTIGQGFASKWGPDPVAGSGAIVTWGFMPDGTTVDPSVPDAGDMMGTSQIGSLRTSIDTTYGPGLFNAAIQRAFDTWAAAANIVFAGPIVDTTGLPSGSPEATYPDIRIGAFHPVPNSGFSHFGAIAYGPPGIITPANQFPESGDIFINLDAGFQIATGTEDFTPLPPLGNDLENLILHELGHGAIGLAHPPWDGANPDQRVMYVGDFGNPGAPPCCQSVNHQLSNDDIAGAQFVYGIRGDYNRNGKVDAADYTVWRDTLGQTVIGGSGADSNIDGRINLADFNNWVLNFGNAGVGAGSGAIAAESVPEPGLLRLMTSAFVGVIFASTHRRGDR